MGLRIVLFVVGAGCVVLGVRSLLERRSLRGDRRRGGPRLLGGRSARELWLWLNGWPGLVVGLGLLAAGAPAVLDLGFGCSRARLASTVRFACDRRSLEVINAGRHDLRLQLRDVDVVVGTDRDGARSVNPVELLDTPSLLELAPGASQTVRLRWPTRGSCSSPEAGGECELLDVEFEASDGRRTVYTSRDCVLP